MYDATQLTFFPQIVKSFVAVASDSLGEWLCHALFCLPLRKVAQHEAETAGAIMAFFLSLGLALGAGLSFGFRAMI